MDGTEKKVVILFCDMVRYSQKTADMRPEEILRFILEYHRSVQKIVDEVGGGNRIVEPTAGDGLVVIFEKTREEGWGELCNRVLLVALGMAKAMEEGGLQQTRIGIFAGDIIEAAINGKNMRFGASFAVASRLEELCGYFGTSFLMDREVAFWQTVEKDYTVSIGKITPKNFHHPIHVYSIYKPGIHNCPVDMERSQLLDFVEKKNEAVAYFCGNALQGIRPDFARARERLNALQTLFIELTGKKDIATERLLEYIRNCPYPNDQFRAKGMILRGITEDSLGIRLLHLSNELLRAMDVDFYHTLIVDTDWERYFKLICMKKGEIVVKVDDSPDGVYFIDSGSVNVVDREGSLITMLTAGNVFGEMAYFTDQQVRNATIVANSDVVLRRIPGEELEKLPVIMEIFRRISTKRKIGLDEG